MLTRQWSATYRSGLVVVGRQSADSSGLTSAAVFLGPMGTGSGVADVLTTIVMLPVTPSAMSAAVGAALSSAVGSL